VKGCCWGRAEIPGIYLRTLMPLNFVGI
jgi:hypothetical protein